jgi:hypothetical protein
VPVAPKQLSHKQQSRDAITSVRPDLKNFHASLSDDQKARFNTMGPPLKDTSSPQQRQSGGQH